MMKIGGEYWVAIQSDGHVMSGPEGEFIGTTKESLEDEMENWVEISWERTAQFEIVPVKLIRREIP